MDSRSTKQLKSKTGEAPIEVNNVVIGKFPLMKQPVDYQLTIHINNLLNTYGKGIIKEFKEYLHNPETEYGGVIVKRLVNHYGIDTLRNWFTLIYGWQFEKVG